MSKFVSLDIETLGLGIDAPIIQFGAVIADWATCEILGEFETNLKHDSYDNCEPFAMSMHPKILREIADGKCIHINQLASEVHRWLYAYGLTTAAMDGPKLTVAGKNAAGFDLPMLRRQCVNWDLCVPCFHRVLDPGPLYWNPNTDLVPPNLDTCLTRAGINGMMVTHTALEDAIDVANVIMEYVKNNG